jgi:hypothetical protein
VQCSGQPVLPVGLKDEMGADTVKIFCPKCQCVYHPPPVRSRSSHHAGAGAAGVDGAAFGTTFPHLFLMTFSNLVPDPLPQNSFYVPRVFGFRVHSSTRQRVGGAAAVVSSSAVLSSISAAAVAAARHRENTDNNSNNNIINKRASFVGRRLEIASKESTEHNPIDAADEVVPPETSGPPEEPTTTISTAAAAMNPKEPAPSQPVAGATDNNDDGSSRKLKTGKRKNDGDASSKKPEANGTGSVDSTSKKRRKGDNGNT